MAKITIDGKEYTVSDGITVVQAAAEVGITIPHYCYHPALRAPGNCRMCLIELTLPGRPGPERQLAIGCGTRVADGMVVSNTAPRVKAARAMTLEFLLIHHPLDCPTCDQAGECHLQDYTYEFGNDRSRYVEAKQTPPRKQVGPHIDLFTTRCVVCTRCVRFCEEITGTSELGLIHRGGHNEIDVYPGRPLDNKLSGNVADICPVGALVSRDFLYRSRPWFLKKVNSVCPGCSKGCNTTVEFRDNEIVRIKPRYHADVNDFWMCDDGRYGYHYANDPNRLKSPMIRDGESLVPTGWNTVFEAIAAKIAELGGENVAILASAFNTNEELRAIGRLAMEAVGTKHVGLISQPITSEDTVYPKFVIEKDKNPNRAGGLAILGDVPTDEDAWALLDGAKGAVVFGGIPGLELSEQVLARLEALACLVVVDILPSALTERADIVAPGTAFTEKEGCFTSSQKRVQRLNRALPPLGRSLDEWTFVCEVARAMGREFGYLSVGEITDDIASSVEAFSGAGDSAIGSRGYVLGSGEPAPETMTGNDAYAAKYWD
ncbi:2Fe-2S iron-sulfur cluster binding domain-containing protein [Candidatus Poribacteria bacterium]|nr:2Fe-2S iron-sulfur cluster binding domain-containing protein [Candidatus Poribacteria bacterium]